MYLKKYPKGIDMNKDAKKKKYIVFRIINGEAWYYDSWDDHIKALEQAVEIGGQFIPSCDASD